MTIGGEGGGRCLMEKIILNFHFDYLKTRLRVPPYNEIKSPVAFYFLLGIVGARSYADSLSGCVGRSKIQLRLNSQTQATKTITHRPHQYLSQGVHAFWICYKICGNVTEATQQSTKLSSETKPRWQTLILSYQ